MSVKLLEAGQEITSGSSYTETDRPRVRNGNPVWEAKVAEAASLFTRAMRGNKRDLLTFEEALSTSDFPILFGEVLDRSLLGTYQDAAPVWRQWASQTTVRDFRPKRLVDLIGGRAILPAVAELTEYPERVKDEAEYELTVAKRGARFSISWEAIVNDDLDGLRRLPQDLAAAAVSTEDYLATTAIAGASGPDSTFFSVGNGNILTGDPVLSATSLSNAMLDISTRLDADGRPIVINGVVLMVPPALELTARNIVNTTEVRTTVDGVERRITGNGLPGTIRVVVNPWLPVIDTTTGSSAWYVFPDPNGGRPAVAVGFLRGYETPDLRVKAAAGNRVGGGAIDPAEGSFEIDDIQYRVRHVVGATNVLYEATIASAGTGDGS